MVTEASTWVEPADIRRFVDEHVAAVQPQMREAVLAEWEAATTGTEEANLKAASLRAQLMRVYADVPSYERLKAWHEGPQPSDPLLARELTLLYLAFAEGQIDQESIDAITSLERDAESTFTNFRGIYQGNPVSDNDITGILSRETDSQLLREAWEAGKQVGQQVAGTVVELARLRNTAARRAGYASHYQRSLALAELDEKRLFALLEDLRRLTDDPFARAKAEMDASLSQRFGLPVSELRPWHYFDPFFQRPPQADGVDLDGLFADRDLVQLAVRTFDGLELDVRSILDRSDLYARPGKNQHAFCVDVDRLGDIRVLCNLENNHRWAETLLHELGHGAYDLYSDRDLPFLLRQPAHTLTTEGVAMLMGRLALNDEWLRTVVGVPSSEIAGLLPTLQAQKRLSSLIFIRWALVMIYFERELYRDPEQDLDTLWWDLVESLQGLRRPEGRRNPDWAAKIHLALYPVYYHNYLLGELMASQLEQFIETRLGGLTDKPAAGQFLVSQVFRPGARWHWEEMVRRATGEPLSAAPLARDLHVPQPSAS
mgnify:CR=1 FL=1